MELLELIKFFEERIAEIEEEKARNISFLEQREIRTRNETIKINEKILERLKLKFFHNS